MIVADGNAVDGRPYYVIKQCGRSRSRNYDHTPIVSLGLVWAGGRHSLGLDGQVN